MKTRLLLIVCCFWLTSLPAQQLQTEKSKVSFVLQAPMGSLEAADSALSGKVDIKQGTVALVLDVAGFRFVTAKMPDYINASTTKRFHEYYLETEQYPQATYTGTILNAKRINYDRNGEYTVQTEGVLTMHGVSKAMSCKGKITVKGTKIYLDATFEIRSDDYGIRKPASLGGLYFEKVKLRVQSTMIKT